MRTCRAAPARDGLWPGGRGRRTEDPWGHGAGDKREKVVVSDIHSQTLGGMKRQNDKSVEMVIPPPDSWAV